MTNYDHDEGGTKEARNIALKILTCKVDQFKNAPEEMMGELLEKVTRALS